MNKLRLGYKSLMKLMAIEERRPKRLRHHPVAIPLVTFFGLVAVAAVALIGFGGNTLGASDAHVIIMGFDGKQQSIPTRAQTVGEFLELAEIEIHEGDRVEPALDTPIIEDEFRVNLYRARPVIVFDGGKKVQKLSAATTPRSVVEQAGITVFPEDEIISRPTENFLRDGIGEQIVIDRATPTNLNLYGTPIMLRTRAKTVGEVLKEKQVNLAESDTVQPSEETPLSPNVQIFVLRIGTQISTEEVEIPMPIEYIEDGSLTLGATAIRQKGSPGKKLVTYEINLQNNKEIGRRIIQEVIQSEPVKQITARGRAVDVPADKEAVMAAAGIAPGDYGYVNYIMSRESGWCPTKLQGQYGACPPYPPASIPAGRGYGLGQATPGTKMAPFGADWQSNPVTQLRWATAYAKGRHGGWEGAYNYWVRNHNW